MKGMYFWKKKGRNSKIVINVRIKVKHPYQEELGQDIRRYITECWEDKMLYVQAWLLKDQQNKEKLKHMHARRQERNNTLLSALCMVLTPNVQHYSTRAMKETVEPTY